MWFRQLSPLAQPKVVALSAAINSRFLMADMAHLPSAWALITPGGEKLPLGGFGRHFALPSLIIGWRIIG